MLYQLVYLLFYFVEVPSNARPATGRVKRTAKKANDAAEVPKIDEAKVRARKSKAKQPEEPTAPKNHRRKVRISAENLPHVLRTKKRASARHNSIESRRSSVAKRGSADPKADPKPFKCEQCSYAGARKNYLTSHMKIHNKQKKK